ncbi:MAG: multidrug efflux pump [Sphingobacteriales bacterium]|jgi:multidrug efflux pump
MLEFKPTSWSIDNKTTIFVITVLIAIFGFTAYNKIAKELFPEIVIPTIYVGTAYPGTSPEDIESLVTRKIEKQLKSISGIKKVTSTSIQDYSTIIAEFSTDVKVEYALGQVKDAVDKAKPELPNDLPSDPQIQEINFSEAPVLFINISGEYDLNQLKEFAEEAKDRLEQLGEITRVDLVGALEREVQINVDMYKLQAAKVTLQDIERAIASENVTISGGIVEMNNMDRTVRVMGEFNSLDDLDDIVVSSLPGAPVYIKDIATIIDSQKERESFARLDGKNVITLNVIKRSGENLIETIDGVKEVLAKMDRTIFPADLDIVLTGDQSKQTRNTLKDLFNSIIIGFILVALVLMFFMGITNAIFVGLAVPLSMMLAFIFMPTIGFTFNMVVLFSFLLALGIIVDNAIVVVENTYRIIQEENLPPKEAAKKAAGQVFKPVLAGTLTTLAPFVPLAFWPGMVGKFMFYLPITLIITLIASLIVAFIINPVFAVSFMKKEKLGSGLPPVKYYKMGIIALGILGILFHLGGSHGTGNFLLFLILLVTLNRYVTRKLIRRFQLKFIPKLIDKYRSVLEWVLIKKRPVWLLLSSVVLLFALFIGIGIKQPKVEFFPSSDPNFVYVYLTMPVGTDLNVTNETTKSIEKKVNQVLGENNPIVESVIANVGVGAGDPMSGDRTVTPHKGKVSIAFVEFPDRNGISTIDMLDSIRNAVKGIPGAEIKVDKEQNGPPTGKPINIEIIGEDLDEMVDASRRLQAYLEGLNISGIEELSSDFESGKPEVIVDIDRVRAARVGLSTAQIGTELRTAIFGKEISKFRDKEEEYPIQLRYNADQRNIDDLMNLKITFRDMNMGGIIKQIPLSAVASVRYENNFGGIKRKNLKRIISLSSNVTTGFTPNEVVSKIEASFADFDKPEGISIKMTGEQEDQKETMDFLGFAMLISIGLIFIILVAQFNSLSQTFIILSGIVLSIIGVLAGFLLLDMNLVIVMTGIGVVALAGIVVNNGILLVEFTNTLREQGVPVKKALIEAGRIRLSPVLLTAVSTMLGLFPMAFGFNINFETLFTSFDPQIYFGGDNLAFWGPLSWTIIFGLSFSTFLTLILVPAMYLIVHRIKLKFQRKRHKFLLNNK